MARFGYFIIALGLVLVIAGVLTILAQKMNFPFPGRLPGDIRIEGKNFRLYLPIATSILLSIAATLVLWLIGYLKRK